MLLLKKVKCGIALSSWVWVSVSCSSYDMSFVEIRSILCSNCELSFNLFYVHFYCFRPFCITINNHCVNIFFSLQLFVTYTICFYVLGWWSTPPSVQTTYSVISRSSSISKQWAFWSIFTNIFPRCTISSCLYFRWRA